MTVNSVDNKKITEPSSGWQTFVFRFVVATAVALIVINTMQARNFWEHVKKRMPRRRKASELLLDKVETSRTAEEGTPIQTLEATINGKKLRVRIFKEPNLQRENETKTPSLVED